MTAPVVTFFNNKDGTERTSLVYHLAWMYAQLRVRVVAVDLDPQANLTAAFLDEEVLDELWPSTDASDTIFGSLQPLLRGVGDIAPTSMLDIDERLALAPGDMALSRFEEELSSQWSGCLDGEERAFRVISSFRRLIVDAADRFEADIALVDVGPNLGAISRAALVAADHVVVPLAADLFGLQGLRNLGPTLRRWRTEWQARVPHNPNPDLELPPGGMRSAGYVLQQRGVRPARPVVAYQRWMDSVPATYRTSVLGLDGDAPTVDQDPSCLAQLKHYPSLIPMAQDARKPVFDLKPADGAFGGHQAAVQASRQHFADLARAVAAAVGLPLAEQIRIA